MCTALTTLLSKESVWTKKLGPMSAVCTWGQVLVSKGNLKTPCVREDTSARQGVHNEEGCSCRFSYLFLEDIYYKANVSINKAQINVLQSVM